MIDIWNDLFGAAPFLRYAFVVTLLSSVALGATGTFVVINRVTYLAGAIAHVALGGIGFALYAQRVLGWMWLTPWLGALGVSVMAAILLSWIVRRAEERADTAISALWCAGMGAGLLFLAVTPGYHDPMSYLFGNILFVGETQLILSTVLAACLCLLFTVFGRVLYAVSMDEEFARMRGIKTPLYHALLLVLIALTIVMMIQVIGVILVIALLSLPAAMAGGFTRRLLPMMVAAVLMCLLIQWIGLLVSYQTDLPAGACMAVLASAGYAGSLLMRTRR